VVLAAGGGSRFGGPSHKLLSTARGRPLWRWAVDAATGAGLAEVFVVVGAVDLPLAGLPVTVVRNERWAEGQATSLQAGVSAARAAGHDAVVVGLAEQPGVTAAAWRAVAAAPSTQPIVVAAYRGRRGNPVRLDAAVWPLLPAEGDAGARLVMRNRPDLVGQVACEGDPSDVDTVEDLEAWS